MTQDDHRTTQHRNGLLFMCVGNTARSQMAEAFARFIGPAEFRYFSAGSKPAAELHPNTVKAMREVGIDISQCKPKDVASVPMDTVATVITLCDEDVCPTVPEEVQHLPYPIQDPKATLGEDDEMLQAYRRTRDQIRELVSRLF